MDIQLFWILILVFSVILTIIAADIAKKKGCNYGIIIVLGVIFTPVIALIVALAMNPNKENIEQKKLSSGTHKKCNDCAEIIKKEANVCRFCGAKSE